jgi:hypothetical protein
MARPEVTGRRTGVAAAKQTSIGHNRGPPLEAPQDWVELQRIVDLRKASELSGLSIDSIKRHHSDKIIELSPRRRGMRLHHALSLTYKRSNETPAP